MPNPKHVRFDNKPRKRAHSDDDDDDDDVAPEQEHKAKKPKIMKEEKDEEKHDGEPATDVTVESNAEVDSKWENLVYYYLARLKGLCDWGSESPEKSRSTSAGSYKSCNSENLEERVLKNVVTENYPHANKYWAANKKLNRAGQSEVNCYMAAGYQEGKEQGVKIITRALKYGVLSGILAKEGSCYKIHPKYMKKPPTPDSTSNSEISIISSASSSNSGDSVGKDQVKRRTGHGLQLDKFQTEPDPTNIQMKRSFSHNEINISNKKPIKHRHNHDRPAPSSELIFRRPSTGKNVQLATRDHARAVSSSRKHRETTRDSSRSLTREVFKPRQRLSRARSREHPSRSQSRHQRRKGRRTKSSSSNNSKY
ncbi:hypothetical protein CBL_07839 [Carabus blaptoides fortunei]